MCADSRTSYETVRPTSAGTDSDLKSVPLSALLKAQRTLDRNADPGPSNSTVRLQQTKKGKGKELDMEEDALLQARLRREHKHA